MRLFLSAWLFVMALSVAATAQTREPIDFEAWSDFSTSVNQALEEEVDVERLEELRLELSERRAEFLDAQDVNAAQIATVESQIAALGPPPEEGDDPEPLDVADRREALNDQLAELRAPVLSAEEAYSLADGLIARIDTTIREEYAAQLLARAPSPLSPETWPGGMSFVADVRTTFVGTVAERWQDPDIRGRAIDSLALVVPLSVIALMLIVRSRWWIRLLSGWVVNRLPRGRGVLFFTLSLGQIVLPAFGMYLLALAASLTELFEGAPQQLLNSGWLIVMPIIVAKWLVHVLLRTEELAPSFWQGDGPLMAALRRNTVLMGYALTLLFVVGATASIMDRMGEGFDVVRFLPRLLLAYLLFRIGRILMALAAYATDGEKRNLGGSMMGLLGRLSIFAGVAAVVLAAIGFSNAAQAILFPTAMTLAVTSVISLLQKLVSDLYALLTGKPEGESEALAPLLIGFALVLLALPIYALIWGARVADLTEVWSRFRAGFAIGDARISPGDFLTFLLIFALGYGLTRFVQGTLRTSILPKTKLDIGGRNAIVAGVGYIGIFLAAVIAITSAGIDLSSLAIVAGALSVGIGFGLQNVVSNFVSGIILLIERPISEGDWIQVGDQMGYVRDISVRSTRIETFDRTDVIVPNADLVSGTVTNWTRGNNVGRVIVPVGVAYGTDTEWVSNVLGEIAEAHPMVILNPPPAVLFRAFGADSMEFEIRAILRDVNFVLNVQSDLLHSVAKRFREEGIEIPYPQRDLWLRNPEALRGAGQSENL